MQYGMLRQAVLDERRQRDERERLRDAAHEAELRCGKALAASRRALLELAADALGDDALAQAADDGRHGDWAVALGELEVAAGLRHHGHVRQLPVRRYDAVDDVPMQHLAHEQQRVVVEHPQQLRLDADVVGALVRAQAVDCGAQLPDRDVGAAPVRPAGLEHLLGDGRSVRQGGSGNTRWRRCSLVSVLHALRMDVDALGVRLRSVGCGDLACGNSSSSSNGRDIASGGSSGGQHVRGLPQRRLDGVAVGHVEVLNVHRPRVGGLHVLEQRLHELVVGCEVGGAVVVVLVVVVVVVVVRSVVARVGAGGGGARGAAASPAAFFFGSFFCVRRPVPRVRGSAHIATISTVSSSRASNQLMRTHWRSILRTRLL